MQYKTKNEIILCAHHLLSLACAVGSQEPSKYFGLEGNAFKDALKIVQSNPNINVKVIVGVDYICGPCSEYNEELRICEKYPKNPNKDKRMLEILDMQEGEIISRIALFKRMEEKIKPKEYTYIWNKERPEWLFNEYKKGLEILSR